MPIMLVCGGECGVVASGAHWSATGGTGSVTFPTTAPVRTGSRAAHCSVSNQQGAYLRWDGRATLSTRIFVKRFYIRFVGSLPPGSTLIADASNSLGTQVVGIGFNAANNTLECFETTSTSSFNFAGGGVTVVADTWYRIDVRLRTDAQPWTCDAMVDGVSLTSSARDTAAADPVILGVGLFFTGNATYNGLRIDDFIASQTAADYPLGSGYVKGYSPNADGSHNTGSAGNFTDQAGTNITNSTTNAYTHIDETPLTSDTDAVEQRLDTSGNLYTEHHFADANEVLAPSAVDVILQYKGTASGAYAGSWEMVDGTNTDRIALSPSSGTTQRYMSKAYATRIGSSAAWTTAAFNALRVRLGFGTDVTPDIRFQAVLAEVAFHSLDPAAVMTATATSKDAKSAAVLLAGTGRADALSHPITTSEIGGERMAPMTASAASRNITAAIVNSLALMLATARSPNLAALLKLLMGLETATARSPNLAALLKLLMGLETATARSPNLAALLKLLMGLETATARSPNLAVLIAGGGPAPDVVGGGLPAGGGLGPGIRFSSDTGWIWRRGTSGFRGRIDWAHGKPFSR